MKHHSFMALGLLSATLGVAQAAQAEEVGLDFSLSANATTDATLEATVAPSSPQLAEAAPKSWEGEVVELSFSLSDSPSSPSHSVAQPPLSTPKLQTKPASAPDHSTVDDLPELFRGGAESLVAKAVGSAEGTRTPRGDRTLAYYGHVDPGNGVWNLGSFSYQHGAKTPEEADAKQLKRLASQANTLRQQAAAKGIQMTLEEELNAIDLANQAPLAALDRGGYIDWLAQAHWMGLRGSEAVLWARTRSFLSPDTGQWNAPGLGNNVYSISSDQERRMQAIAQAIAVHQQQYQQPKAIAVTPQPVKTAVTAPPLPPEEVANQIIFPD